MIKRICNIKIFSKLNVKPGAVFVLTFWILLCIPVCHINFSEIKSSAENRNLAKFPWPITQTFGRDFDAWFNDRFFGRQTMLLIDSETKYTINTFYQNNKAIYDKSTDWMFGKSLFPRPNIKQADNIIRGITEFDKFCSDNGIKLYILVVPRKENVYSEFLDKFGPAHETRQAADEYVHNLQKSLPQNKMIYPMDALMAAKENDYIFFKESHHWTDWGAYIGYSELMNVIQKDFPKIPRVKLSDYNITQNTLIRDDWGRNYNKGHTVNMLNLNRLSKDILNTPYNYYTHRTYVKPNVTDNVKDKHKDFHFDNGVKYRMLMIGTSQNENLTGFLPYSFRDTMYIRLNNVKEQPQSEEFKILKHYKGRILKFNPDIMVLTIIYENLNRLPDLNKEK